MALSIPINPVFACLRSESTHPTSDFPKPSDFTNMELPDGSTLWFAYREHTSGEIYYLVKILRSGEQQAAILDTARMNPSERRAFLLYQCRMDVRQSQEERRVSAEQWRISDEQQRASNERVNALYEQRRAERGTHQERIHAAEERIRAADERIRAADERIRAESDAFNEQMNAFSRQNEALVESSFRPNISTPNQSSFPSSIPDQTQLPSRSGGMQIPESSPLASVQSDSSVVENNVVSNGGNQEENPSPSFFEKIQASIGFFLPKSFRT